MNKTIRVTGGALVLPVVVVLASCSTPEVKPPPEAPRILAFKPDQAEVLPGSSTTLRYSVEDATSVEVFTSTGEPLALDGDATAGSVQVTPGSTEIYVLRATGAGGRAAAFTQVLVGEALASVFMIAVPPEIDPGAPAEVVWSAQGASEVTLFDATGTQYEIAGTSGVLSVNPTQSTTFTLTAKDSSGAEKKVDAVVKVRPTIEMIEAAPGLVNAGDALTFQWKTAGAEQVVITEKTFGSLYQSTGAGSAREGLFTWTIPANAPGSTEPLLDGFRLEFTVTVSSPEPATSLTRTFVRHLGTGPVVEQFRAPETATPGREIYLSWRVSGAERVQLFGNGMLVAEPRSTKPEELAEGGARLPAPTVTTRYELVVHGFDGASAKASKVVDIAPLPVISGFNVTTFVNQAGDAAAATWKTQNATLVNVRVKNGPVVYSSSDPATVADGQTSLYPARSTTFVLDAINAAGDLVSVEQSVTVGQGAVVTVTPEFPVPTTPVTVGWDLPAGDTLEVIGVPHGEPTVLTMSNGFIDLTGQMHVRTLEFANRDEDTADLSASVPFRFPFVGTVRSRFVVSTNGFVAFEPTIPSPVEGRLPAMLSPFSADLELGAGEVLYRVDGTTFPRRLIIQWKDVRLKGVSSSSLSFQVQLYETGEVRYAYATLDDGTGGTAGLIPSIGVNLPGVFSTTFAGGVSSGHELVWFVRPETTGSFTVPLPATTRYSLFYRRANGTLVSLSVPVTAWSKDVVSITEAMAAPIATNDGQWLELTNTSNEPVDLTGLKLTVGSVGDVELPEGVFLDPGKTLVLGQSTDPTVNGGATVDVAVTGLTLAPADSVALFAGLQEVSKLEWTETTSGVSIERSQKVIDGVGNEKVCPRESGYGPDGVKATIGARREACWSYLLEPIAYAPADIVGSGQVLFIAPQSGRKWVEKEMPERPFEMFGVPYEFGVISANGFISFVNKPGTLSDYYAFGAEKTPEFSIPNAAVVPFGGGFDFITTRPSMVLMRRVAPNEVNPGVPGHLVVQWVGGANSSDKDVDINFQAKLFDDGVIEFHYAKMANGTKATRYAEGASATTWIEDAMGAEALMINAHSTTPGIQPYSAWRYTPVHQN